MVTRRTLLGYAWGTLALGLVRPRTVAAQAAGRPAITVHKDPG